MAGSNDITYSVIQFIELPYNDIDKYIIVPYSWIRIKLMPEGTVIVAYPIEDDGKTYERVKNNEKFQKSWKQYEAAVKYEAESFSEARFWITATGDVNICENSGIELTEKDDESCNEDNFDDANNFDTPENEDDEDNFAISIRDEDMDIYDDLPDITKSASQINIDAELAPINNDEQIDNNDNLVDADSNVVSTIDDDADNNVAPVKDAEANNYVAPVNDDTDTISPLNNDDRSSRVASINNNELIVNNEDFDSENDRAAPIRNNVISINHFEEDSRRAPTNAEKTNNSSTQLNAAEAFNCIIPTNDVNINDDVAPTNNDKQIDKHNSSQNAVCDSATKSSNAFTQTRESSSVIRCNQIKSLETTINETRGTIHYAPATSNAGKPRMTVMPLRHTQKAQDPLTEFNKNQQIIKDNSVLITDISNHLNKPSDNFNEKQTYPGLQDNSHQIPSAQRIIVGTSAVKNIFHQEPYHQSFTNFSNTSFHPPERLDQERTLVPVDYWPQDRYNQPIVENSAVSNAKMSYSNSGRQISPAIENLQTLMKQQAEFTSPVSLQDNNSRLNYIDRNAYSQNENTASMQHLAKLSHKTANPLTMQQASHSNEYIVSRYRKKTSRNIPKQSNQQSHENPNSSTPDYTVRVQPGQIIITATSDPPFVQNSFHSASLGQVPATQNIANNKSSFVQHSFNAASSDQAPAPQNVVNNKSNFVQHPFNAASLNKVTASQNIANNKSHFVQHSYHAASLDQIPPPQNVVNNRSPFIQNSDHAAYLAQLPASQNIANNKSPHSFHTASQPTQPWGSPKHRQHQKIPTAYDPRVPQWPVTVAPVESNPMYQRNSFEYNTNGPLSIVQYPERTNVEKQTSQFYRPTNSNYTPTVLPNYTHQVSHAQRLPRTQRGPHIQGYINNVTPAVSNLTRQSIYDRTPIVRDRAEQDNSDVLLYRKASNANAYDQRNYFQGNINNTGFAREHFPAPQQLCQYSGSSNSRHSFTMQHFPSSNQRTQYSEGSNGRQLVPIHENNVVHDTRVQNLYTERLIALNSLNPQINPQIINNSVTLAHKPPTQMNPCYSAMQTNTVQDQSQSKQNHNTQNAVGNAPPNLTSCTSQSFEYVRNNQLSPHHQDFANLRSYNHPYDNYRKQNICQSNTKDNRHNSIGNYDSLVNQVEACIKQEDKVVKKLNDVMDNLQTIGPKNNKYDSSDAELSTDETTIKKSNNVKDSVQRIDPKNNKRCLITSDHSRLVAEKMLLKNIETHFSQMKSALSKAHSTLEAMQGTFTEDVEIFKKVVNRITNYIDLQTNEPKASSSEIKLGSENSDTGINIAENSFNDSDMADDYSEDDDGEYFEPPQKKSLISPKNKHPFILPPEYNPEDTRWTLKHQEASPELVELLPRNKIFVSSIALGNCKRVAKDFKTLANMLLKEVFNDIALSVCSITDARDYDRDKKDVRPELDRKAIIVIQEYVNMYGSNEGWSVFDLKAVQHSMRCKLKEFRPKCSDMKRKSLNRCD